MTMDLPTLLSAIDAQDWDRIAERLYVEEGINISPDQARQIARDNLTRVYHEDTP